MLKKMLACIVSLSLIMSVAPIYAASGDTPSSWAKATVTKAIKAGIVPERLQSKYQSPITREEFAELIVNAIFEREKVAAGSLSEKFYWTKEKVLDRVTVDFEFEDAEQEHVKLAYIIGTVNGVSDTRFEPNKHITRQEAAVMLMNTSHQVNGIGYLSKEALGYSDYDKIAEWAKPAVSAAASVGIMLGDGKKFNYAGKITREEAIKTAYTLYQSLYLFSLKGNIFIGAEYEELRYKVGKDFVAVTYEDDGKHTNLDINMYRTWNYDNITSSHQDLFTIEKAIALFAFYSDIDPLNFSQVVTPTMNGKSTKWDYGYMVVSFLNTDSIIKFQFKPIKGYVSKNNGYKYGYPFKMVEVKEIK
ncbi:S-layer homology domain-containing protein [Paenibacillus pinisoli]|uniref:S-layer homology domain-containing protein n=1 Tax=Paenibacillus pinisoli TaxID=1276110 RepID=A0A3A6PQG7_9BACL|nr:S-layer homology domain-containing protein [Paenibacillus pinisoli]RJX41678.1 S-layer homology domain-containing protein [Paenibacillus pinisoli]